MRKFIQSILLFFPFIITVYIVCIFVAGTFFPSQLKPNINYRICSYGHMFSRLQAAETIQDVDILFLGSSHAYRGFDTRIYSEHHLKTFNLGSSSQTPIQTKLLLSRYLNNINPKTIIYEVFPETFTMDGVESSVDIIANDKNDIASIKMAITINNINTYNTLIYGFTVDLLNLNKNIQEATKKDNDTYIPGGFVEKEMQYYTPVAIDTQRWIYNEKQLVAFEEILAILKSANISVILVYAPITSTYYNSILNNEAFDKKMIQMGEYYNFNKILTLNDTLHFYDEHHLNQTGVELFNNKLLEIIKK